MPSDYNLPFSLIYDLDDGLCSHQSSVRRYLSNMKDMFLDEGTRKKMEAEDNRLIYEYYDSGAPQNPGDLSFGTSIVYPGSVGNEFFMTYGHFHNILNTAEIYLCLKGQGYMMMENSGGEWEAVPISPGAAVYCPKGYAHRSINTGSEKLVTFYTYRADAGHNYGIIKELGFRKLVVKHNGAAILIDNPKRLNH